MKRMPTLTDRERRRINNARFKKRSMFKWELNRRIPPSQKNLRWWQRRDLHRRQAPHRLAKAVMNDLIGRYQEFNGRRALAASRPALNIFDFWIDWLRGIQLAARLAIELPSSRSKKAWEATAPILELINAIKDLKLGTKSEYTAAFFPNGTSRKRGDRSDPPDVAEFKKTIGLTFRLIRELGFCKSDDAVKHINEALRRSGMRHTYTIDSVKKWSKFVSDEEFKAYAALCVEYIMIKIGYLKSDHRRSPPNLDELINLWKGLVKEKNLPPPIDFLTGFIRAPLYQVILRRFAM